MPKISDLSIGTASDDDSIPLLDGGTTKRVTVASLVEHVKTSIGGDFQPTDADLTAIAALATTEFGRGLLEKADAAALRAALGTGYTADLSGSYAAIVTGDYDQGIHVNATDPDYGPWFTIGNDGDTMGFAGTPPGDERAWASLVVYKHFGDRAGLSNADVTHTTQAIAVLANYWGKTIDDSAQASSFFVALKDTGTGFTQTKPLTAVEGHCSVEGANNLTGGTAEAVAFGARLTLGSGTITTASMFAASGATSSGTITNWYAFRQKSTPGGTVTNKFGLYVIDPAISETQVALLKSGTTAGVSMKIAGSGGGSPTLVDVIMPNVTAGETDLSGIKVRQGSGGLKNMQEWWTSGGSSAALAVTRFGGLTTTNTNIQVNNSSGTAMVGMRPDGFYWHSSTLEQTTVGAAGAASALPATPTKYLKVKDSAGTVLVIPAYAAS